LACPAGVEPATYGLEGLANLRNTMPNNRIQRVGLRCLSKHRGSWRWVESRVGFGVSAGVCREN
jgi:hypothetical protein